MDAGSAKAKALIKESLECLDAASRIAIYLVDCSGGTSSGIVIPEHVIKYRDKHLQGFPIDPSEAHDYQKHLESKAHTLALLAEVSRYIDGPW